MTRTETLRIVVARLDALSNKRLGESGYWDWNAGCACAIGQLNPALARGDCTDGRMFDAWLHAQGVPAEVVGEVASVNDAGPIGETPEDRFVRVRTWLEKEIHDAT